MKMLGVSDDFIVDRLCRRYSVLVYFIISFALLMVIWSQDLVFCWTPNHFSSTMDRYAQQTCSKGNDLYRPISLVEIPVEEDKNALNNKLKYNLAKYRYLPLAIALQALLFLLPRVLWNAFVCITGYHTDRIVRAAYIEMKIESKSSHAFKPLGAWLIQTLKSPFPMLGNCGTAFGGYPLVFAFFVTKLAYLAVCAIQWIILQYVYATSFLSVGSVHSAMWQTVFSDHFKTKIQLNNTAPADVSRTLYCDFSVRHLGMDHRYTVQCETKFEEKAEMFLFMLWLWQLVILSLVIISTSLWLPRLFVYFIAPHSYKIARVSVLIGTMNAKADSPHYSKIREFSQLILKPDGLLFMEMLDANLSPAAGSGIIRAAWQLFLEQEQNEVQPSTQGAVAGTSAPPTQLYPNLNRQEYQSKGETIPLVERQS